jgi:hypothetical protein
VLRSNNLDGNLKPKQDLPLLSCFLKYLPSNEKEISTLLIPQTPKDNEGQTKKPLYAHKHNNLDEAD